MIIIVDAYNLLKQLALSKEISAGMRTQFIKQLAHYGKSKGHSLVVVFDGGSSPWVERVRVDGVLVLYSGAYKTADEVIKDYLNEHRGNELFLVSSDNDLIRCARNLSVESLDSMVFYKIIMADCLHEVHIVKKVDEPLIKTTKRSSQELDALMEEAGKMISEKNDQTHIGQLRKSSGNTLSKGEKNILKKIKKL